jgi:hypothetical protein
MLRLPQKATKLAPGQPRVELAGSGPHNPPRQLQGQAFLLRDSRFSEDPARHWDEVSIHKGNRRQHGCFADLARPRPLRALRPMQVFKNHGQPQHVTRGLAQSAPKRACRVLCRSLHPCHVPLEVCCSRMAQGYVAGARQAAEAPNHGQSMQAPERFQVRSTRNGMLNKTKATHRLRPAPQEPGREAVVSSGYDQPELVGLNAAKHRNGQVRDDDRLRVLLPIDGISPPAIGFEPHGTLT